MIKKAKILLFIFSFLLFINFCNENDSDSDNCDENCRKCSDPQTTCICECPDGQVREIDVMGIENGTTVYCARCVPFSSSKKSLHEIYEF